MPDTAFPTPPDSMTQTDFMACFGGIYEHSPWVAAALWDEGLGPEDGKLAHFAARMRGVVDAAPHEKRLALLRAHPELAGKLAVADGLTAESKSEQAGAGLDRCTPAEFARFTALNARYSDSFGHPFIIAVKGLDRAAILTRSNAASAMTPRPSSPLPSNRCTGSRCCGWRPCVIRRPSRSVVLCGRWRVHLAPGLC